MVKLKSRLAVCGILIVLLLSMFSIASAAGEEHSERMSCVHSHYMVIQYSEVGKIGRDGHYIRYGNLYTCADCGYYYREPQGLYYEDHFYGCDAVCTICKYKWEK